jgi:hypothetical protein
MESARWLVPLLLAAAALGCGGSGSPTGLTGPTPSLAPPPQPPNGRITEVSIQPEVGATVHVRDCEPADGSAHAAVCVDQFRALFDVVADRPVRNPVLTVGFYDGVDFCGYAAATADALVPGQTLSFSASGLRLSSCALPLTTTRMLVEVWSDADFGFSLKRELPNSYTFRRP